MDRVTFEDVLAIAKAEIGYTETPADSNRTKYGRWFGMNGQPWCMMFIMWCFFEAGGYEMPPAVARPACQHPHPQSLPCRYLPA